SLHGKILRLDPPTGAVDKGNTFPRFNKVWALGLRNPWRFSFDTNGDLYVGDVGQNQVEELDVLPRDKQSGANYGWSVYEGDVVFKKDEKITGGVSPVVPALTYTHAEGGCSITGGDVYHGAKIPFLKGSYVFGDYCTGHVWASKRTATGVTPLRELGVKVDGLQAFGKDLEGELLVLSADKLYRLVLPAG
ncbi:MAG: glucose/sorbosone dehydrogenase-like protein, partial [Frankiales bacterium]|nr:glucose/sorbosone dehydrogenase-like protein [Frankiales bacterium]